MDRQACINSAPSLLQIGKFTEYSRARLICGHDETQQRKAHDL